MEDRIYPRNFPKFVRFRLEKSFREQMIGDALTKVKDQITKVDDLVVLSLDFGQDAYEFLFGEIEGKIIKALQSAPLPTSEIIERTGLKKNTFYHTISQMIKEGMIVKKNRRYGLRDPLYITYSSLKKGRSLGPEYRKTNGVSKDEVILALYLWPKYQVARKRENIGKNHVYAAQHSNIFSLAHAVKMWRKGCTNIPQWALISMAFLAGLVGKLNNNPVIEGYSLPPGIEITPYFRGRYKVPVEAEIELDKIVIQLWSKGSDNGRKYNHKNKKDFFYRARKIFGSFKTKEGRVPLAVVEIIKKQYEIKCFKKERARIPRKIVDRLGRLKDPERAKYEAGLFKGIIELGSSHRQGLELTARSFEFLEDTSRFLEGMGNGRISVRKRVGRPHYRSNISSRKIAYLKDRTEELEKLYRKIERIYPDYKIWKNIPLNTVGRWIRSRDLSNPQETFEEVCKEELFSYLGSILKSIERNTPGYGLSYFDSEDQTSLTDYFWNQRKLPDIRSVKEQLRIFESPWVTKEPINIPLFE
ncbi:MAG: winged helix-turn-helix domain-containing protein [Candidatus Hydrothermarchaeales archaeon]